MIEVVKLLQDITQYQGRVVWNRSRPDGQLHRRFDTSKAKALLGWQAQTELRAGLLITVDWYRQHQGAARK